MDPLSALGLAGNVVQFIDFGCKLFTKAKSIHRDGGVAEHSEMRLVVADLRRFVKNLRDGITPPGIRAQATLSDDETVFRDICEGCLKVAEELEQAVSTIQVLGKKTKWKSIRQALKSIWGKEHIAELKNRLHLYSEQLDRRLARHDAAMLDQKQQYIDLNVNIYKVIDRTEEAAQQANAMDDKINEIAQALEYSTAKNDEAHKKTQKAVADVSTQLSKNAAAVILLAQDVLHELRSAISDEGSNCAEAQEEIFRIPYNEQQAAMNRVRELKEEVHLLRTEFGQTLQQIAQAVGHVSAEEEKKLRKASTWKRHLWLAKKLVLQKILGHLDCGTRDLKVVLSDVYCQFYPVLADIESWGSAEDMEVDFAGIPDAKDMLPPAYEEVVSYTTSACSVNSRVYRSGGTSILTPEDYSGVSNLSRRGWTAISSSGHSVNSRVYGEGGAPILIPEDHGPVLPRRCTVIHPLLRRTLSDSDLD